MSKPMTKARIAQLKSYSDPDTLDGAKMLELIAEVERLQKLARPNRKPKTRKVVRHVNTTSPVIYANYNGGSEAHPNPDFGKVCPCKDCANGIDNRDSVRKALDSYNAWVWGNRGG